MCSLPISAPGCPLNEAARGRYLCGPAHRTFPRRVFWGKYQRASAISAVSGAPGAVASKPDRFTWLSLLRARTIRPPPSSEIALEADDRPPLCSPGTRPFFIRREAPPSEPREPRPEQVASRRRTPRLRASRRHRRMSADRTPRRRARNSRRSAPNQPRPNLR